MVEPTRSARLARLSDCLLYACLPLRPDLAELTSAICAAGAGAVQLRQKDLEAAHELAAIAAMAASARASGALVSVNDRADLAVIAGADILHVGQNDLTPSQARYLVGSDMLIGTSTHTPEQAVAAADDPDVDYFCAGPVHATPTKPGRPAAGLDQVHAAATVAGEKPWFAIGGMDLGTIDEAIAAGARRVVVVRAVTEATDPGFAASAILARLRAAP